MTTVATRPAGSTAPVGDHGEPGVLIVLEGIDRSGRSTHARRLEEHLRYLGRGVARTSLASSALSGDLIRAAKRDRHADPTEAALLYAADLAERVMTRSSLAPSLRGRNPWSSPHRYRWTPMARAEARGVDGEWLEAVFGFAPPPDAVLFLEVDAETSLARRVDDSGSAARGAARCRSLGRRARELPTLFQGRLCACFDRYAAAAGFTRIGAAAPVERVGRRVVRAADAVLAAHAMTVRR